TGTSRKAMFVWGFWHRVSEGSRSIKQLFGRTAFSLWEKKQPSGSVMLVREFIFYRRLKRLDSCRRHSIMRQPTPPSGKHLARKLPNSRACRSALPKWRSKRALPTTSSGKQLEERIK